MAKPLDTGADVVRKMMEILSALGQSSEKSPITRTDKKDFKEAMKEQGDNSIVLYETNPSTFRGFLLRLNSGRRESLLRSVVRCLEAKRAR